MSKRKKNLKKKRQSGKNKILPLIIIGGVVFGSGGYYIYKSKGGGEAKVGHEAPGQIILVRKEIRPTFSPSLFVGMQAEAYQIAKDIPDVLDQIYCYCYCDREHGHKSLLTCFVDTHAAN